MADIRELIESCIREQISKESIEDAVIMAIDNLDFSRKIAAAIEAKLAYELDDYISDIVDEVVDEVVDENLENLFN